MKYPRKRCLYPYIWTIAISAAVLAGCEFEYSVDGNHVSDASTTATRPVTAASATARVMTYNIQFFSQAAAGHGNRIEKLKQIIKDINPTVVAVQEVADRAAMELVFLPSQWQVVIDDDSPDKQDVAFAVRKPWKLTGIADDLDADDENFLAEGPANEAFFPNRRDALFINVETPDGAPAFTAVNIHAKARVGGRSSTDPRRVGAARVLVEKLKGHFKGRNVILMGDFNDSPDDVSLNILESGDANAAAGDNPQPGAFMINLTQPLWIKNMVTEGANYNRYDRKTGLIRNIYPEARDRNNRGRGRDAGTGPIMFDQILVSSNMQPDVIAGSANIYLKRVALEGPGFSRPSDHLPVYIDLKIN